jgi:hypothetical protein
MLSKRNSASSLNESIVAVPLFDVSLAVTPGVLISPVIEDCGGGGGVVKGGVSILPAKAVKESANVSTVAMQSCLSFLILNLLSILSLVKV